MAKTPATQPQSEEIPAHDHNEDDRAPSTLGDRIIAVATLALGVAMLILAFQFPEPGQPEDPGTAALPQLIGAALLLLGVLLFFNTEPTLLTPAPGSRLRTGLMVVAAVGYTLALAPLGFITSTLVFMVLGLLIMGVRRVSRLIGVPILVTLAIYYLFTTLLGVYLPSGAIEGVLP